MRVFLFDWDCGTAARRAAAPEPAGIGAETKSTPGGRGCEAALSHPPEAVLLLRERRPFRSRERPPAARPLIVDCNEA